MACVRNRQVAERGALMSAVQLAVAIVGRLPARMDTVLAEVLAKLLEGERKTGMDSVWGQSTTRLSAAIHKLTKHYGWQIDRNELAQGTNDGRAAYVTCYWIDPAIIAAAMETGAGQWIADVYAARRERRKLAGKCKSDAAKLNAARKAI